MALATLAQTESELKATGDDVTAAATIQGKLDVLQDLKDVTANIETYCQDYFAPYLETRPFDATQQYIDWYRNQLMLDRSLLSATAVVINNTTLTAWDGVFANRGSSDYTLYPYGRTPASCLQGLQNSAAWYPSTYGAVLSGAAGVIGAITVEGVWCNRSHYPGQGWKTSGETVQNNPLAIDDTEVSFTDANKFSPGQFWQLESEIVEVQSVDEGTLTATVERGVRGSVAVAHALNTPISIWIPEPEIQRAAVRWAAYLFKRQAVYEKVSLNAAGTYATVMPSDMPDEVANILKRYINIQSARV